jgi:hypothetical protein
MDAFKVELFNKEVAVNDGLGDDEFDALAVMLWVLVVERVGEAESVAAGDVEAALVGELAGDRDIVGEAEVDIDGEGVTEVQVEAPELEEVLAGQLTHEDAPLPLNVLAAHWLQDELVPPTEKVPGLHE